MTKRKLTNQQQRRVAQKQAKILDTPQQSGLVIAHYGNQLEIENQNGQIVICNKRQNLGAIVAGDNVIWQLDPTEKTGVVVAIEPRCTILSRPDARGNLHAVAANVDQIFIIVAPTPAPSLTTIDRYIVAAIYQNLTPIIVLNKEDLLAHDPLAQQLISVLSEYAKINIATIVISAKEKQHLNLLHEKLNDKTSVFVGQSGVGKSSIISTLLPDLDIQTGDLSTLGKHGKHTTTTARLYHVPHLDARIIDSPGIREFPLWSMDAATLAHGFIEFRPLIQQCKFSNCKHLNEPGCALIVAAQAGKISASRLQSYQKILTEL